ncbi:MAG: hypothetical protein ACR2OG_04525 [Gemmatimonadaceae bacterium]
MSMRRSGPTLSSVLAVMVAASIFHALPRVANAQAGVCRSANCGRKDPPKPTCDDKVWEDYKKKLKNVQDLYDESARNDDEAQKELRESLKEVLLGVGEAAGEEVAIDVAHHVIEKALLQRAEEVRGALGVFYKQLAADAEVAPPAALLGTILELALKTHELSIADEDYAKSLDANLKNTLRLADGMWDRILAEAQAAPPPCDAVRAELQSKLKAEQKLNDDAQALLDGWPLNANGTYHIGDENYDGAAAFAKAKAIVSASDRSALPGPRARLWLARYGPMNSSRPDVRSTPLTPAQVKEIIAQIDIARSQLRQYDRNMSAALRAHRRSVNRLLSIRARMAGGKRG